MRCNLKSVELEKQSSNPSNSPGLGVRVTTIGIKSTTSCSVKLPIPDNMINKSLHFSTTQDPENLHLVFQVFCTSSIHDSELQIIGTGVVLLSGLYGGFAHNRVSLIRDYTIPILANSSMTCIGTVTTSNWVVTPFLPQCTNPVQRSPRFWELGSPQVVGHRGFGANSIARTHLQLGENTVQSCLTVNKLGASCVEFDVQHTKDCTPVIFHDFLVMGIGGDLPLHMLTFNQFLHSVIRKFRRVVQSDVRILSARTSTEAKI